MVDYFYPLPSKVPIIIGVTGTNGKTSVAWTLCELTRVSGKTGLYAGTPGVFLNGVKQRDKVATTTPSFLELRKLIFKYQDKIDLLSLEVSSHALAQDRLQSIKLDAGGWSNFTQDHLDFHKTMEEYFEAKRKIVNLVKSEVVYFPKEEESLMLKASFPNSKLSIDLVDAQKVGLVCNVPKIFQVGFPCANLELSISLFKDQFSKVSSLDLSSLKLPPGRFQIIEHKDRTVVIDYAHTPDALTSVLKQVRETFSKKVMTVFGCGGDRDKLKRPLMAEAAEKGSDSLVVTSDNPRSEDPISITKDIVSGITSKPYTVEVDRKKAIAHAISQTDSNWVVLIAGKGHEDYQEIKGVKHPFDDAKVVQELLR